MSDQFKIKNLSINIEDKQIVKGLDLTIKPGEVHALMGPNGSGKSTLAAALAGHPSYEVKSGSSVQMDGQDLLEMAPDERANAGLFLAFQHPVEIPGVKVQNFLRQAHQARFANQPKKQFKSVLQFRKYLQKLAGEFGVDKKFLKRELNAGFSGGEKKKLEILQMAVLEPQYAILDETDSGLDIDAIKAVSKGIKLVRQQNNTGMLLITHYRRILDYTKPDFVHVMINGKIVESGDMKLVAKLEKEGYGGDSH